MSTKTEMKEKKRDTNFELLRIVSMFAIIIIHYVSHSDISDTVVEGSVNYYLIEVLKVVTRASVNLYILISGYYMINSKMKFTKLFDICLMVIFYSIIFLPIPFIMNFELKPEYWVITFFPINSGEYWFATAYIALYALSPFLNLCLKKLNKKQYKMLLIVSSIPIVISKTIFNNNSSIDPMGGASLIFFIYLYMVAGYLRLHYNKQVNKKKCLAIAFLAISINCIVRCIAIGILKYTDNRTLNFSNMFTVLASICIFLYFKEIKIKNETCNKVILTIAPLTFGIYLIHENILFKFFLWRVVIIASEYSQSPYLILHIIACTIAVFGNSAIVEFIRQKLFKLLRRTKLSKAIYKKLDKANDKFWEKIKE